MAFKIRPAVQSLGILLNQTTKELQLLFSQCSQIDLHRFQENKTTVGEEIKRPSQVPSWSSPNLEGPEALNKDQPPSPNMLCIHRGHI